MGCNNYATSEDVQQMISAINAKANYFAKHSTPVAFVDLTKYFNSKDSMAKMAASIKTAALIKSAVNVKTDTKDRDKKLTKNFKKDILQTLKENVPNNIKEYVKAADIDHAKELQGGGKDAVENLIPLHLSVNRSVGAQVMHQTKTLSEGDEYRICVIGR